MRSIYVKHPFRDFSMRLVSVFMAMAIAVSGFWVSVAAAASTQETPTPSSGERIVTIYDQSEKQVLLTKADSVAKILEQADIPVTSNDIVEPGLDTKFVASEYTINIYRAHPVMIVDGMRKERVLSPYTSAKDIAKSANIELHDEDIVDLSKPQDIITDGGGMRLAITRATPVNLKLYGKQAKVYTQEKTVGELLKSKKITLGKNDTLSVAKSSAISKNMNIEIWRNGVQTVSQEEEIAFAVRHIEDADRPVGYREIQTPGEKGKKNVTYEITMKNGQEVARKEIQNVVLTEPKEQVEIVGAKPSFDGDFAAALAKLRSCEGGYGSWNPAGPYYGAYQFDQGTWSSVSSAPYGNATPAEQDAAARALYERRGWSPWPHCGSGLPDTFR